jgi:hypothetical protein
MSHESLLTQAELDFIQNMQHNPKLNVRDATRSLTVNGGRQIQDLLTRLAAHEQMTFPLHLVEDEFHALHLELGAPSIFEEGPRIRPWRLTLPEPIALETEKGAMTALWAYEISFKGVLLENRRNTRPPKVFAAWFSPEGHAPIALRGTFERLTESGLAAYRLSQHNKEETERLRQYILQQHRKIFPTMHR